MRRAPAAKGAGADGSGGGRSRLERLTGGFGLSALDVDILLISLLPDIDARYERLFGYLNDDVTRRRATIGLVLDVCAVAATDPAGRSRLAGSAPLTAGGLLVIEQSEQPFLARSLRVPDRVTAFLLGDDTMDARLTGLAEIAGPDGGARPRSANGAGPGAGPGAAPAARLAAALLAGVRLAYLRERPGAAAGALAAGALELAGRVAVHLDLDALGADPEPEQALTAAVREARLRGGGLVAGPVQALELATQPGHLRLLRSLAGQPLPVLLTGAPLWDPHWTDVAPLVLDAAPLDGSQRAALWWRTAGGQACGTGTGTGTGALDAEAALAAYLLGPQQLRRAAQSASHLALLDGADRIDTRHLRAGVRAQNSAGLDRLARRIEPAVGWDDLVLPEPVVAQLHELAIRVRHRERVLGGWRMRPGGGRGRGVLALFAGDSGTGKTMSAEVIASDLGLELYVVDLSTVVDKYVGQTEKNLERIFTEAAGVNGVLLFDEADAIFGKRSEVKDAHDRYANMESAYLLQRMESFDGIAVLTTNLRANLDEAFTRRLDLIVDFPVPDVAQRLALWDRCLGRRLPRGDDLDLEFCARSFELAGGSIRACAVTAAYLAAAGGRPVGMADLIGAVQREYRKLGRLLLASEFGEHAAGLRPG